MPDQGTPDPETCPPGIAPLQFLPDTQGRLATCVWQGDSIEAVQEHIDFCLGDASYQEYFAVAEDYAFGLPVTQNA